VIRLSAMKGSNWSFALLAGGDARQIFTLSHEQMAEKRRKSFRPLSDGRPKRENCWRSQGLSIEGLVLARVRCNLPAKVRIMHLKRLIAGYVRCNSCPMRPICKGERIECGRRAPHRTSQRFIDVAATGRC